VNAAEFVQLLAARSLSPHQSGAGWQSRCAGHEDRNASLSISTGNDGRILLKCHAGCSAESIVAALGLTLGDLFPPRAANGKHKPRMVAAYDYHDETGKLLFQCVRFEPKDFRQRRPDPAKPGGWIWNLKDTRRVLYRLREVKAALAAGRTVFVAEGEKDCDVLTKHGFAATCNPMGAGKWQPEHTETLRDAARVVVIADKDTPGRNHAQAVAGALHGVVKSMKLTELPDCGEKPVKDATDWFAAGGTPELLRELVKTAPEFTPPSEPQPGELGSVATTSGVAEAKDKPAKPGKKLQGRAVELTDVEPWPEVVNGAELLGEVAESFARYVALPEGAADALALWCAHAHAFNAFLCSPRLNISSPEKGCGKTTLRDVVAVLVSRPLPTENLSVAVLFRLVEAHTPTILADEYDAWLRDNEELRGLLNAGHRRGGIVYRCEGDSHEVRGFQVFAPAVVCGIGALPGTLHDRSIIVRLERAKPGELRERFDSRRVQRETDCCRKLARWCADNTAHLEACEPVLPSGAFNRLADNWRPLFAVAEIAEGDWPQRAATAFAKLTSRDDADAHGIGAMLLADIRQTFAESQEGRTFSKSLVETLCGMSDRPWPEAHRGKPITETWLARRLHHFGISSRTLRIGTDRAKGYELADFAEAFARYLPAEGQSKRDSVTTQASMEQSESSSRDTQQTCHVSTNHQTPANIDLSRCHASLPPVEERELVL
jgi:hypothetical protein